MGHYGEEEVDLEDIRTFVRETQPACVSCGKKLVASAINMYDHNGGIKIKGKREKQWVYVSCIGCGYDSALWKLLTRAKRGIK